MIFSRFMKRLRAGQSRFTRKGEASVHPSFYNSDLFADLAKSWWEESKGSSQPECWQAMLATWIETVPASAMDGVELRALADFASKYQEGTRRPSPEATAKTRDLEWYARIVMDECLGSGWLWRHPEEQRRFSFMPPEYQDAALWLQRWDARGDRHEASVRNKALFAYNKAQEENEEDRAEARPHGRHA